MQLWPDLEQIDIRLLFTWCISHQKLRSSRPGSPSVCLCLGVRQVVMQTEWRHMRGLTSESAVETRTISQASTPVNQTSRQTRQFGHAVSTSKSHDDGHETCRMVSERASERQVKEQSPRSSAPAHPPWFPIDGGSLSLFLGATVVEKKYPLGRRDRGSVWGRMGRRVSLNHVSLRSHHPVACGNQGSLTRLEIQYMGFTQRARPDLCEPCR